MSPHANGLGTTWNRTRAWDFALDKRDRALNEWIGIVLGDLRLLQGVCKGRGLS